MKFIALLIVLALVQYWGSGRYLQKDQWYQSLLTALAGMRLPGVLRLLLAILLPAALMAWVLAESQGWLFGLVGLALHVVLLLYCLGRGDYQGVATRYREQCRAGNFQAAFISVQEELPRQQDQALPEDAEHLHRWVKQCLVYMGFERWFAVIFYFMLFGAPGALVYRLLHLSQELDPESDSRGLQKRLLHVADWLPARLLVLAFALTGDYMGSREQVTSSITNLHTPAAETISDAAHAALGLKTMVFSEAGDSEALSQVSDWEIAQLQSLMSRSAVSWVLVIAVLVLLM